MIHDKTTFVIGAGASFNLGFPLGDGLRKQIINLIEFNDSNHRALPKDEQLSQILLRKCGEESSGGNWVQRMDQFRQASVIIQRGLPFARSIDSFLEGLRGEQDVNYLAKLAIVMCILRAEEQSPLKPYTDHAANAKEIQEEKSARLEAGWQAQLGQMFFEGHDRYTVEQAFAEGAFVIFNYDRCIEEFLITSLSLRFALDRARAAEIVAGCKIVHPYGQTGSLDFNDASYVPFGASRYGVIPKIADEIKTYTETMDSNVGATVREYVGRADTIVFLGFGWLPQNVKLLAVDGFSTSARRVFATTMLMPIGEIDVIRSKLDLILKRGAHTPDGMGGPQPSANFVFEHGDCTDLMTNCWLRLTN